MQKIHAGSTARFPWLDVLLLLALVLYTLLGISLVPFHGDESAFLILSEDYDRVFKDGKFERVLFNPEGGEKQNLRLTTGSILAFSIGFVRDITDNDDPIQRWLWGASWEENLAFGNMPSPRLLNLARFCSAVMGAVGIVLFFLLARDLFSSRVAAWLAALALATQGGVLVNIRRAMQEGPKFLMLILTAYVALYVLKNLDRSEIRKFPYFLLGIASGLTLAAKQDTAPVLVAIFLALALLPVFKKETARLFFINGLYLGAATLLAYAFFLLFMPVFWRWWESAFALIGIAMILLQLPLIRRDRIAMSLALAGCVLAIGMTVRSPALWGSLPDPVMHMLEFRDGLVDVQIASSGSRNLLESDSYRNRLSFLLENMVSSRVMYFENTNFDVPLYREMIAAYEGSLLSGRTGSLIWDGLILMLALLGGWTLLKKPAAESLFVYSLLLVTGIFLFFMIPLSWQRYFLVMQIPYLLFAAAGGAQVGVWVKGFRDSRTA